MEGFGATPEVRAGLKFQEAPDKLNLEKLESFYANLNELVDAKLLGTSEHRDLK